VGYRRLRPKYPVTNDAFAAAALTAGILFLFRGYSVNVPIQTISMPCEVAVCHRGTSQF